MKKTASAPKRSKTFKKIAAGLNQAIAIARGEMKESAYRVHVVDDIDVKAVRRKSGLSQRAFADAFGFTADAVQDWEQKRRTPDRSTRAYLTVIDRNPKAVRRALRAA
jgi:putative transcriptional regulator